MNKKFVQLKKIMVMSLVVVMIFSLIPTFSSAEGDRKQDVSVEKANVATPAESNEPNNQNPPDQEQTNENQPNETEVIPKLRICLDPGHAGYENRGYNKKYWESVMTWRLTGYLKAELEKNPNVEVVMTKKSLFEDHAVYKRGTMAKGCDLFISIHSNHSSSNRTDYPLAIVSAKTKHDGDSLYSIAAPLGKRLAAVVGSTIKTKQKLQVWVKKQSGDLNWYGVIRGAAAVDVPGIILEHSFHSNKKVCNWLLKEENLKVMAKREAEVIISYFNANGEYGNFSSATTLPSPKRFSSYGQGWGSTVTKWSKVKGAKGYYLYRANSKNGKYHKIVTTRSLSYKNTNLIAGKKYYYKVRAYKYVYNRKRLGLYSKKDVAKVRPKATKIKLKVKKRRVTIRFTYLLGVKGYKIYRATSRYGKYKLVKRGKKLARTLSWKDKKLKKGRRYYYRVQAYTIIDGRQIHGVMSKIKSIIVR